MKTIELNNKKYQVPTDWNEVTLRMQMKVSADSDAITIPELKKLAILSGYASIDIDELKHAKLSDLTELFNTMKFINEPIPAQPIIEFEFNGSHYYCGQHIAETEFQDFMSIHTVVEENSGNTYQALPTILAIMCKKKKANGILESLDDYDVRARAEEFLDLPITIAQSLQLFFSIVGEQYSNAILLSSNPELIRLATQSRIDEVENMLKKLGGKGLLTRCAIGILRFYLKSIKRQLNKHFISTPAES